MIVLALGAVWATATATAAVTALVWWIVEIVKHRRDRRQIAGQAAEFLAGAWEAREDREGY